MSLSTTNGILLLAVCTVFVSMPHGTVSSRCRKSSECLSEKGCVWCDWSGWTYEGVCNVTCGGGIQFILRNRTCVAKNVGTQCSGNETECNSTDCNTQSCTRDGGWSLWNNWYSEGSCFEKCGVCAQLQTRNRTCSNPYPSNGGNYCNGSSTDFKNISCDITTCPLVNGGWSAWVAWTASSSCSVSCGGGTMNQVRTRFCNNPQRQNGGKHCNGTMSESQKVPCNTESCYQVDAIWSDWTTWTSNGRWDFTCKTGTQNQTRTRSCSIPQNCGSNCEGDITVSQIVQCNKQTCPPECPSTGNATNCRISSISMTKNVQTPFKGVSGCTSLNCICDETFHGYIRHPSNCTKFIKCAFNKPFISSCESGTYWNQNLQICDQGTC